MAKSFFYKTDIGYLHELTKLVYLLILNNKGITTPEIITLTETSREDCVKVLEVLIKAGSITNFKNGFMKYEHPEGIFEK